MSKTLGFVVDAAMIAAPNSTKNCDKNRYPEMIRRSTVNQWCPAMKANVVCGRLIHAVECMSANAAVIAVM